ncbi:hypothetical protein SPSYN_03096 [Sporotomaculum syntrophicum]|uniref:Membrane protein YkvI n=1 Tax=Sporotomaculum syntrophicum TaxID=182264 RepID=A0A9D2WLP9_9FIRM|nr:hypothetical protein [Sporotomaculum syntrophicum]KAF1083747.1 hypothetical protein SPSYN_03096 [Sporotomaculum syntrophicum]
MDKHKKCNPKAVIRIAGAFIAFLIGAGFATGQEILQFFSSYGYVSYGIIILNLIGFLILGQILLATGNEHQDNTFEHFTYYCGKKLGTVYSWLIPVTLFLIISVMISASGSTISEYFGVNRHLGSALMAFIVVGAYLVGFEKLVKIVSAIGPVIIIFALFVGAVTVVRDFGNFTDIAQYKDTLELSKASPNWILSAMLYLSLCFLTASTFYTALGKSATDKNEARLGATLGAVVFILALAIMSTAIMLNAKETSNLAIPTLYLACKISYVLGGMFSVILVLGIFSACSTMMWTVCSRFYAENVWKNRMFAIAIGIAAFIIGQFSFSKLINVFYPFIGYAGLIFIGCVVWKGTKKNCCNTRGRFSCGK